MADRVRSVPAVGATLAPDGRSVLVALLSSGALLSQGAGDTDAATADLRCVVSVSTIEEFCPGEWEVRIGGYSGAEAARVSKPSWQVERWRQDSWERAWGPPGGGRESGPDVHSPAGPHVMSSYGLEREAELVLRDELCDWRVSGFPGRYRARVRWAVNGDGALRLTEWCEFEVVPGDPGSAILRKARDEQNDLWRRYKEFMNQRLAPGVQNGMVMGRGDGGGIGRAFADALDPSAPLVGLDLPQGLMARVQLVQLQRRMREAHAASDAATREAKSATVLSEWAVTGNGTGWYGAFARLQHVLFARDCLPAATYQSVRSGYVGSKEADVMLRMFPQAAEALKGE